MKNKLFVAMSLGGIALGLLSGQVFAQSITTESKQPLKLNTIVSNKVNQPTVVETYTMGTVYGLPNSRVWVTKNYGVLPIWGDAFGSSPQDYEQLIFSSMKEKNNNYYAVTVISSVPESIIKYYAKTNQGAYRNFMNGKTVYSKNSVKGHAVFTAESYVPMYLVPLGKSVDRLSNGTYRYPNGRVFRFQHWEPVPESEVPNYARVPYKGGTYFRFRFGNRYKYSWS